MSPTHPMKVCFRPGRSLISCSICSLFLLALSLVCCTPAKTDKDEDEGFVQIFDGETLNEWEEDPSYWRVENGNLVGEVTPATLLDRNTFINWRGGLTKDFELKGNRLQHYINGALMSDVIDNDTANRSFSGLLGVQVHVDPPMKIEYRNFRLKQIE